MTRYNKQFFRQRNLFLIHHCFSVILSTGRAKTISNSVRNNVTMLPSDKSLYNVVVVFFFFIECYIVIFLSFRKSYFDNEKHIIIYIYIA